MPQCPSSSQYWGSMFVEAAVAEHCEQYIGPPVGRAEGFPGVSFSTGLGIRCRSYGKQSRAGQRTRTGASSGRTAGRRHVFDITRRLPMGVGDPLRRNTSPVEGAEELAHQFRPPPEACVGVGRAARPGRVQDRGTDRSSPSAAGCDRSAADLAKVPMNSRHAGTLLRALPVLTNTAPALTG